MFQSIMINQRDQGIILLNYRLRLSRLCICLCRQGWEGPGQLTRQYFVVLLTLSYCGEPAGEKEGHQCEVAREEMWQCGDTVTMCHHVKVGLSG